MVKKLLAVAVAVIMMICTASVAYADNEFTLTVEKVKAKAGDTVEVDITISNNPGIWGAEFSIRYDNEALDLKEIVNGDIFGDSANAEEGGFIGNTDTTDGQVSFMNEGIEDVTGNGVLCTLKFKVNSDADAAVYDIDIITNEDSFFDADFISYQAILNTGNITVDNGTVVVTNSMPATTAQTDKAASAGTDKNDTSSADRTDASEDSTSTDSTTAADITEAVETTTNSAVEITTSANDDNDSPNTALYIVVALVIAAIVVGTVLIIIKQRKPAVEKETQTESTEDNTEDKE